MLFHTLVICSLLFLALLSNMNIPNMFAHSPVGGSGCFQSEAMSKAVVNAFVCLFADMFLFILGNEVELWVQNGW